MFLELASRDVFSYHPATLMALMEKRWNDVYDSTNTTPRSDFIPTPMTRGLGPVSGFFDVPAVGENLPNTLKLPSWDHLIYAYMIENTRIVQIFRRIIEEILSGERFGALSEGSYKWVQSAVEVFFRNGNLPMIFDTTSALRPHSEDVRRNAYHRMLGMDLNHGTVDNRPAEYVRSSTANTGLVAALQDLLRETWRGVINKDNSTGINMTDNGRIVELAEQLRNMLLDRRRTAGTTAGTRAYGMLAREEFVAVSMLSWFHLTVNVPSSPIIVDLKATSITPEGRLRNLGELVGLPAHSHSRSFIHMAVPASRLLRALEIWESTSSPANDAARFYEGDLSGDTLTLINHWSLATGADLKALPVSAAPR